MAKITSWPVIRAMGIIMLMFLWSLGIKAQTANTPVLTWDQEVGCIEYNDERSLPFVYLFENMESSECVRFCEGSRVNYTFQANNVASVQWQVTGGTVVSSSNTDATVQWGGRGNGNLSLSVVYTDNSIEVLDFCVEIIASPQAYFEIDGINPYQMQFCINTPISFNNLSTDNGGTAIVHYFWDFGDGNTSSTFEPTHAYIETGIFPVTLTVTNSCNCSTEYVIELEITDGEPVEIVCQNVTCEGMTEQYSSLDGCTGDWDVIGGTIVVDNGSDIEVVWDQVDPEDGFGYVSYRSHCGCPHWTTIRVPVVMQNGVIKGPQNICEGKQGRFTMPQWPTTDFQWQINGDPNHPMLVYTEQRNEVVVDGATPGSYVLEVKYFNTLFAPHICFGDAKFNFDVIDNFDIITDPQLTICTGVNKVFNTSNGSSVNWQIRRGTTLEHTDVGTTTNYTFTEGGTYVVTGNFNGCEGTPVVVEVIPKPVVSADDIIGPDRVCLNVPYTYTVDDDDPEATYLWSVSTGGSIIGSNGGIEVDIKFSSPTATVTVIKQYEKNGVICESDPATYNVSQIVVSPTIINNSGLLEFCPSSTATFTADLNGVDVDHIEWDIVGTGLTTNFGNVIDGIHSPMATVSFNEISSGISTGLLRLHVTKCGITTTVTHPIQLITLPTLTLDPVLDLCPTAADFEITINSSFNIPGQEVEISYNGGPFTGNYPFMSGTPLTITNGFTNYSGSNITQTLTVRLKNACAYQPMATQTVTVFPLTQIDITPGYDYSVCPDSYDPITLYANISTGTTPSVTYDWYKQGNSTPIQTGAGNTYIISNATQGTTPGGTYYVVVTDGNGCVVTSENVEVEEFDCSGGGGPGDPGPGCTGVVDPDLAMAVNWDCDTITGTLTMNPSYLYTSIFWEGSPHLTLNPATQGTPNALFTTDVPGVHIVRATVQYGSCTVIKKQTVIKHYEPKINVAVTCSGSGIYTVNLLNNSTIFNIDFNDIDFEYSGPGVTGPTIGDTYTITGVTPGTYTYTLTLSAAGKPTCSVPITITIDPDPNTSFSLAASYCAEDPVTLSLPGGVYYPDYEYRWIFNSTSYVASGVDSDINFAVPTSTNVPITLQITNRYGCVFTSGVENTFINKADFDGDILPATANFCENNVTPLSFVPSSVPLPSSIIWMRDHEEVGTGMTYQPTQSGSYWPVLIDAEGCKDFGMVETPAIYELRKPPYVSINGNTTLCHGESTMLSGIITDLVNVEHRWVGPSLPVGYGNWVTGNTNLTLTLSGLAPGTYTYTLEARPISDPTCSSSFETTVTSYPALTSPTITATVFNCQPYTLELTASGPGTGTYNWSNGMTGQTIYVNHGGAYSVTYTSPEGCRATGFNQLPHSPERTLWIVPTGCYWLCMDNAYLLGPWGQYDGYEWNVDGSVLQSGSGTVPDQMLSTPGHYQLSITHNGCTYSSTTPFIDPYGCLMASALNENESEPVPPVLKLSPNPAAETTTASYDVGSEYRHATSITVHDITGVQRLKQNVSGTQGEVMLHVGHLSPGTYLVNLQADGQNIAQQKLIKK